MIKTIFLTGASGFIGSHILQSLISKKFTIFTTSRAKLSAFLPEKNQFVGNFFDPNFLYQIANKIDCVIHCAAIRGEKTNNELEYQNVNVTGNKVLLDYAREHEIPRFLYISTVGVLGTIPNPQPASMQNQPNPDSKYHQSKWQAEELVRQYQSNKLNTLILRPTITYGMGDNGFISKMIELIRKKRFVLPVNEKYVHLLCVEGFARLIIDVLRNDLFNNRTYIVADKDPISLQSLVDIFSIQIFNQPYPLYLNWPDIIFHFSKTLLRLIKNQQLLTSLRLISENWIYDISNTIQDLGYKPFNTSDEIIKSVSSISGHVEQRG